MKKTEFEEFNRLVGLLHDKKYDFTAQMKYDGYVLNIRLFGEYAMTVEKHSKCASGRNTQMDVYSICSKYYERSPRIMKVDEIMCLLRRYEESLLFRMRQQYQYGYKTEIDEMSDGSFMLTVQSKFLMCNLTEDANGYIEGDIKVFDNPLSRKECSVLYVNGDAERITYSAEEIEKMFRLAYKRALRENKNNSK